MRSPMIALFTTKKGHWSMPADERTITAFKGMLEHLEEGKRIAVNVTTPEWRDNWQATRGSKAAHAFLSVVDILPPQPIGKSEEFV